MYSQLVLDEIKKCMMDSANGFDWIGTQVRASSYALLSTAPATSPQQMRSLDRGSPAARPPLQDSASPPLQDVNPSKVSTPEHEQTGEDIVREESMLTVKCLGTIVDYCPGIDEHFILFDEEVIAPRWVSLRRGDGDSKPQDVEVLLDWACEIGQDTFFVVNPRNKKRDASQGAGGEPVCELCHRGTILGVHGVVTCSVCRNRHLHRHCMPMSKMQLSEHQEWRCWYCTCRCRLAFH